MQCNFTNLWQKYNPKVIVIVVKILVRGRGRGRGYQYIDLAKPKSGVRVGLFSSPSLH